MPVNGPDCAWLTEPETDAANNATTANISRLTSGRGFGVRPLLLPRGFPSTAARYARRCPIPFSRSGVATELTICICTTDRDAHKPLPSDAAGNVGAGGGNFTIRNGQRGVRRRLARSCLGHDRDTPKSVIRGLGGCGSGGKDRRGGEGGKKKCGPDAIEPHESVPDLCAEAWLIQSQCVQNLLRRDNRNSSQQIKHLIGHWFLMGNRNFRPAGFPGPQNTPATEIGI